MKGYLRTIVFGIVILLSIHTLAAAQVSTSVSSVTQTPTVKPSEEIIKPDEIIKRIEQKQESLVKEIEKVQKSEVVGSATQVEQIKPIIEQHVKTLEAIHSIHSQQTVALNRHISLQTQQKQYADELANFKSGSIDKKVSYIELDRTREELNVESLRGETLNTKIQLAQSSLNQAKKTYKEKQTKVQQLNAQPEAERGTTYPYQSALAEAEVRLATETLFLHTIETKNEERAKSVYQTYLELLKQRIDYMEKHATFSFEDLGAQQKRIDKDIFSINQELKKLKDQQSVLQNLLSNVQNQRVMAQGDKQRVLEAEENARRHEVESLQTKIDHLTIYLVMLEDQKTAWQRRYSIFNFDVEKSELDKWRSETREKITTLNNQEQILTFQINDWQNRLITLNNTITTTTDAPEGLVPWLTRYQKSLQQSIEDLRTHQQRIESTRRLLNRLIDEINEDTAKLTLQERIRIILDTEYYHNRLTTWLYALITAVILFFIFLFIRRMLVARLQHFANKDKNSLANFSVVSIQKTHPLFLFILAIYLASLILTIDQNIRKDYLNFILQVALIIQGAIWISIFVRTWIFRFLLRKTKRDEASLGAISIFNFISQMAIWSITVLLVLQSLGQDVTTLIAGLGIGGVAVALALQNILGDLFSSLSIVLDRPFVVGDFIIFDNFTFLGTVEQIGIKTTRIRSLTGEQIICSNSDLLSTRIRNFKRMRERRVLFQIGVVYQTSAEQLQKIPTMIRETIEGIDQTRFDRAHFSKYGDFALIFEIVYYVLDPDYNLYMDIQQRINLEIFNKFKQEGIEFAYPTQSIFLENFTQPRPPAEG